VEIRANLPYFGTQLSPNRPEKKEIAERNKAKNRICLDEELENKNSESLELMSAKLVTGLTAAGISSWIMFISWHSWPSYTAQKMKAAKTDAEYEDWRRWSSKDFLEKVVSWPPTPRH